MIRRLTADLDFTNPLKVLFYIYRAIKLKPNEIVLKKSNSKGFHLIIWVNGRLSKKRIFELREYIGDDKKRIELDKKRKKPRQYLFYKKRKARR